MNDMMKRFLASIQIDNVNDFDIEFLVVKKNAAGIWKMEIEKQTAWNHDLLNEFKNKLFHINYPYELSFKYACKITPHDEYSLLKEWYQSIYQISLDLSSITVDDKNITIIYDSVLEKRKYKNVLADFNSFLDFICYPKYIFESVLNQTKAEEINLEDEHRKLIEKITPELQKQQSESREREKRYEMSQSAFKRGDYHKMKMHEIDSNSGNIEVVGNIFARDDDRQSKTGLIIATIYICDDTYSIMVKLISGKILTPEKIAELKVGVKIRLRGSVQLDKYSNELLVMAHYVDIQEPDEPRGDDAPEKRVELHLHTKMSAMDAVTTITDYCKLAAHMGHKAIGLTDHGVVQAFPEAQKAAAKYNIKVLYGCEMYMVDGNLNYIKNPSDIILNKGTYVVFDFETTGLSARYNQIIEFGAVKFEDGVNCGRMDLLVNPGVELSAKISNLTNITNEMLVGCPTIDEAIYKIKDFIGDSILVSHNADFDIGFLDAAYKKFGLGPVKNPVVDTLSLSRYLFPESHNHRLGTLCRNLDVVYEEGKAHRADYDAEVLLDVWLAMLSKLTKDNMELKHSDLGKIVPDVELLKHIRPSHVIVYAKNANGLKDLFRLVSLAHIDYLADLPKIPRVEIEKYRVNLLIGSACANGEVFDTAMTRTEDILEKKISFYDYIEIQPLANYSYLVNEDQVDSIEQVQQFLKDIVSCAEKLGKMVVATGDCHYLNPEDKIYRDVYISAKGIGGVRHPLNPFKREHMAPYSNPDQHFRSTTEMLEAFSYFGEEKAKEYVITNTNKIADMMDVLMPIKDKLYTPYIENCAEDLQRICYEKCHDMYGDPLPPLVAERLDKELTGIIKHQYSVIYYIAHKLIKRANDDGFMVGSRGSVGSSFVATMASITEVNPLPPHYRCPKCKKTEFVNIPGVTSGFDLPPKTCPDCGIEMVRDGQDIPFATFLGFNADKVPDIDLNFSGEYQGKAHEMTKELLGKGNVFKAGTIETVAEKTAYGYVLGYYERMGINTDTISKAEIRRLATGCQDVKRTTGQHPGGIVVIPRAFEVFDFTPIQYPADEKEASWKTTHFDFHAIHDNVLKLDLLGHVDPTAMKMLRDYTDIDPKTIPMTDPETLSLFSTDAALHRKRNYLKEETGALGLPEFGTNFVRGMLKETKPKKFADLLIISGLSHGTGVWNGNAQDLIQNKTCTLSEVIGCRDDIMVGLSHMGVEPGIAFKIMEDVRKGKKVKPEFEEIMKKSNVPQWYIDSCNKIQYMFPKAHATAYVMMAIRVAWYKVHRPLDFYANYFSIRCDKFDLAAMLKGETEIIKRIEELRKKKFDRTGITAKEEEIEKSLCMSLEMAERGFKFSNINLYKSEAQRFIVDKETQTVIPSFSSIDGLGAAAAESVVEARKNGPFLSKEDLLARTKLNSQNISALDELHALDGLEDTNQIDLFSFSF